MIYYLRYKISLVHKLVITLEEDILEDDFEKIYLTEEQIIEDIKKIIKD